MSPTDYIGSPINGDDSMCTSNIIGRRPFEEDQWLVGDVFLKNVYSVFDYDKKRIGFAAKASKLSTTSTTISRPTSSPDTATSSYRASTSSASTPSAEKPNPIADTASPSVSVRPPDSSTSAAISSRLRQKTIALALLCVILGIL
ncbi:MAG: hypothetical protein LQ343_007097 [Gyalolechia ehrenbergii]|nr:MAG: hypothetical protein LQ343_007097 [Gyalolechia ehrenbergii]